MGETRLEKLQEMLAKDTLKLKSDKARKAEQTLGEILRDNSLVNMQIRCFEMASSRDRIIGSSIMDEIKNNIAQYQDQLDQLRARKESVETHETVKSNTYNLTMDKINSLKRTVEKNVFTAIDKKIQIA